MTDGIYVKYLVAIIPHLVEEAEEDDDDINEEEQDDISWDELARDDEGSSSQLSASAQAPPGPTPTPAQLGEDARTEATDANSDTPSGALA
jgi:hypothetical protein